ncbi:MAG: HD domain-containing protein [Thermoanaerobaculia bacterium]
MNPPEVSVRARLTERLVVEVGAAFQQRAVYAPTHPQVERALALALAALADFCAHVAISEVSLITLEGQLLVERQAVLDDAPWARGLLQAFRRHGIRGLTLGLGLDAVELGRFLDGCLAGKGARSSRHILVGQAGFSAGETEGAERTGTPGGFAPELPAWLTAGEAESTRAELDAVASGAVARIEKLRSLVSRLTESAHAGALAPLRLAAARPSDRPFLHGLAVALSTLRLGRALGISGEALEELALAGLLHDVGFLEVPRADESPAERRRLHPMRGAARLAALEGAPELAVLVAYEHHLRFDGAPNYPLLATPRIPSAAARVVAVADTWETLRGEGKVPVGEVLAALDGRAGTFLDPAIVALFLQLVSPAGG